MGERHRDTREGNNINIRHEVDNEDR